jgi:hypothetical protein
MIKELLFSVYYIELDLIEMNYNLMKNKKLKLFQDIHTLN